MTPKEKELIDNLAGRLKGNPVKQRDAEAETYIQEQVGSSKDAVYQLSQAVLIQEMALKEAKEKVEYLEKCVGHEKEENERGVLGRMMGGKKPAPQPPQPQQQPSQFGGFMRTAAGVAVGMVAGSMIASGLSSMMGGNEAVAEEMPEDMAASEDMAAPEADQAVEEGGSFLDSDAGFASSDTGFGSSFEEPMQDSGFGGDDSMFAGGDTGVDDGGFDEDF